MAEEIPELASGVGALEGAVPVDDQRAVAVVEVQAAVRTSTHADVLTAAGANMGDYGRVLRLFVRIEGLVSPASWADALRAQPRPAP